MSDPSKYETVVGLEVHAQLLTKSKLFCGDSIAYGAEPNTQVSPITLGHPGTLPKMNKKAIELAIRTGLACHCEIEKENFFVRKNYFYPDLPKGYQVSQHSTPICKGGFITIRMGERTREIRLNRIHLEEDAGKSLHDADPDNTYIDFNRAGTALIEIVTEPDIRSGEEAYAFLSELRKLVRYLEVCDGNMEEGSLRCDANISVRIKGETKLGTRVEVKNLNSIRNVKRAIEEETRRLIEMTEAGQTIVQQTRSFDANNGTTFAIRDKEEADDYRYFAEPDLTPFRFEDEFINSVRETIPALPEQRVTNYIVGMGLNEYDARVITEEREFSDFFEKMAATGVRPKAAANWLLGPVKEWLNENNKSILDFPLDANRLVNLVLLVESGKVSYTLGATKLFHAHLKQPLKDPWELADELGLIQQSDAGVIASIADEVLEKYADKVIEYKNGKKGLLALFVGEVMKRSKGKADPQVANEVLLQKLKSSK